MVTFIILACTTERTRTRFYFIFHAVQVSGYHFQLGIFCKVYLYKYNKNSFENIRTDINIGDFQEEDSRRGGGGGIQDFHL